MTCYLSIATTNICSGVSSYVYTLKNDWQISAILITIILHQLRPADPQRYFTASSVYWISKVLICQVTVLRQKSFNKLTYWCIHFVQNILRSSLIYLNHVPLTPPPKRSHLDKGGSWVSCIIYMYFSAGFYWERFLLIVLCIFLLMDYCAHDTKQNKLHMSLFSHSNVREEHKEKQQWGCPDIILFPNDQRPTGCKF